MKKGFSTIMSAQFFSSLADNALLVAAVELLRLSNAPAWQTPALASMFALFYVVLAPFVGAFADALPKGRVMFVSNAIKVVGCLMMLFGSHPLLSYAIVGLGAAVYSPAKYGILTELLPASQLVKGNGWIEGLTVASIVLGIVLGGQLIGPKVAPLLLGVDFPWMETSVDTPPEAAISAIVLLYIVASGFNLFIPRTTAPLQPVEHGPLWLIRDFSRCNARAAAALGYATAQASNLAGVVIIGSILGAVTASAITKLDKATNVIPLAIGVGILMIGLNVITNVWVAAPFLVLLGGLCGYLIVPMNALLQHRGHNLMGAGRSIAVQNFNEQACILALSAFYAGMTKFGASAFVTIAVFGLMVAGTMELIRRWHQRNLVQHRDEVERLLAIARSDGH